MDEVWTHAAAIFFTFVGVDEGDEFSGAAADVAFNTEDDTITGTMRYHQGDDLPFVWRRTRQPAASAPKPTTKRKKST